MTGRTCPTTSAAIPDFPKPGILFRDITPLLAAPQALRAAIHELACHFRPQRIDVVAAAEARGFIFAAPLALELNVGLVPIRKKGKLPFRCLTHNYDLEYGTDVLQIHEDAIAAGARVLVVDDLLATGGTVEACCKLIERAGGRVAGCTRHRVGGPGRRRPRGKVRQLQPRQV